MTHLEARVAKLELQFTMLERLTKLEHDIAVLQHKFPEPK